MSITVNEFMEYYDKYKDNGFVKLMVESKRLNQAKTITYYNLCYWNSKEYVPLLLNIKKSTLFGGVKRSNTYQDSSPYVVFRKSSCQHDGLNFGSCFALINSLYLNAVKSEISKGVIEDANILQFVQDTDKNGNLFDDEVIRLKARVNQSNIFTFGINEIVSKKLYSRQNLDGVLKCCDIWMTVNFSYVIKSANGYSSSACIKDFVYRNRANISSLVNEQELLDLSDDE